MRRAGLAHGPGCERGWIHLDDQRYEARDVQWLLAKLVDQLVARPDELGVTGISYGGGTTMQLAMLADRIRRPDGVTESWQSPDGVPLHIAAAWARWPWSDLADALQPNGRLGLDTYASPVGVEIQAYVNALYALANTAGFVAPLGADPGADLTAWNQRLSKGEPYGADVRAILEQIHTYHGVLGLPIDKGITPLLIQSGWTDDLFPVGQGLRIYDLLRQKSKTAPVALQLGDLGHSRAANHPGRPRGLQRPGPGLLRGAPEARGGSGPAPGSVTAYTPDVPEDRHARRRPVPRVVLRRAARGEIVFRHKAAQRVTSSGGDAALSQKLSPLALDPCKGVSDDVARGTAVASVRSPGLTVLGMTHVRADVGRDRPRRAARRAPVGRQPGHRPPAPRRPRRRAPALAQDRQLRPQRQRLQVRARPPDQARAARARQPDLPRGERHVQRDGEAAAGGAADAGAPGEAR